MTEEERERTRALVAQLDELLLRAPNALHVIQSQAAKGNKHAIRLWRHYLQQGMAEGQEDATIQKTDTNDGIGADH